MKYNKLYWHEMNKLNNVIIGDSYIYDLQIFLIIQFLDDYRSFVHFLGHYEWLLESKFSVVECLLTEADFFLDKVIYY